MALNAAECARWGRLLMLARVLAGDVLALGSSARPYWAGLALGGQLCHLDIKLVSVRYRTDLMFRIT